MDISSLLSPQDSPVDETPPPPPSSQPSSSRPSPAKRSSHRQQQPLAQPLPSRPPSFTQLHNQHPHSHHHLPHHHVTSSPQYYPEGAAVAVHTHHHYHTQHPQHPQPHLATGSPLASPGITSYQNHNGRAVHSATSTPPIDARNSYNSPKNARATPPQPLLRSASTPGMDTLADLASMQQQQSAARQSAGGLRDPQVYHAQRPSLSVQNIPRSISGSSGADITMSETPRQPREFASQALSQPNLQTLKELDQALITNPFDYEAHTQYITILHQGLQNHMESKDGHTYELLEDLREAYRTMDKIYPLGETYLQYWINDEKALARNAEERLLVEQQLFAKALKDEPKSVQLWFMYGEYVTYLHECSFDNNPTAQWSSEDKALGREIWTWEVMVHAWERGAEATMYNLRDSHIVWDRYAQALIDDLRSNCTHDKVQRINALFEERLLTPHAHWDDTFSTFSTFTSNYNEAAWEDIMDVMRKRAANAKKQYSLRSDLEFELDKALQANDRYAEHAALTKYMKWETRDAGPFSFNSVTSLFERAVLRFPSDTSFWEHYIEWLIRRNESNTAFTLEVLERATRHCPWSGDIWTYRITTLEAEGRSIKEIQDVKHSATETGLLEHGGLEELLKVQVAWCGYLRRKALDNPNSSDDDVDVAEVGIRSALDDVSAIGQKKYGDAYQGDPQYRLERIHIKFCTQNGNIEGARAIWESLVSKQHDSYEFWYRYYIWEMVVWSNHAIRDRHSQTRQLKTPSNATDVLRQGLKRIHTMDYPEQLIQMFVNHCEQHESVHSLRLALISARRATVTVQTRRAKEMEMATTAAAEGYDSSNVKRKREDEAGAADSTMKKSRQHEQAAVAASVEQPAQHDTKTATEPKRNREHTTIIVKRLPRGTTQVQVRQFFSDCGNIRGILIKDEPDSVTATVEFDTELEAEYALSKEVKGFHGAEIDIKMAGSTQLFVTNYVPYADEEYIRGLFGNYGKILEVRFPSLKFDSHRRFCYVQFTSAQEARAAATKMDGELVNGLKLQAKISDPNVAKKREGATAEGREIYIWHIEFKTTIDDIRRLFEEFGKIERIKLPVRPSGANKGFCFVVYETKEQAAVATAKMDGFEYRGLEMHVEIASPKHEGKKELKSELKLDSGADSITDDVQKDGTEPRKFAPAPFFDRSIVILHIPDTVKDARIADLVKDYEPKKVEMMPRKSCAIVEFKTVEAAGKAGLKLDGFEITPGCKIKIGTHKDIKEGSNEHHEASALMRPVVNRPNRPVARGVGRRGGLGSKRGGLGSGAGAGAGASKPTTDVPTAANKQGEKTNDYFRAMFLAKDSGDKGDGAGDGDVEMNE